MELGYQQIIQEIQQSIQKSQVEGVQPNFEPPVKNQRREDLKCQVPLELLICLRCGEVGHKKKDCMKIVFCTNCSRNNHIASRCRQPFKENCAYCKRSNHIKEYCPVKRIDSLKLSQAKEFQISYGEQPRTQLAAGVPRTEEYETLASN